jgi:hypothetical protein
MSFVHQLLPWLPELPEIWISSLLGVIFGAVLIFLTEIFRRLLKEPLPTSHKIAVIGLPGAGKTTLITAIFELLQRGIHIDGVRLHGLSTIETVNRYIANLNAGRKIGPTLERDTFVFRFSYFKRKGLVRRLYDVEIADFPGEYSRTISSLPNEHIQAHTKENSGMGTSDLSEEAWSYTLFGKEFFSWIASSREYLFLIDLSSIYSKNNVRAEIADMTARVRTSWQVIEDSTTERGIGSARNRSVHLIFTKTDTLLSINAGRVNLFQFLELQDDDRKDRGEGEETPTPISLKETVAKAGISNFLAEKGFIPDEVITRLKAQNDMLFSDLIQFFTKRTNHVDIIYSSMTLLTDDGTRLGVLDALKACLP